MKLPSRVRLLSSHSPDRITYLDETDGDDDPPVLSWKSDDFAPSQVDSRASNFLIHHLIDHAGSEYSAPSWLGETASLDLALPGVCSGLYRLAPKVYGSHRRIYFADEKAYGAWLESLPADQLHLGGQPRCLRPDPDAPHGWKITKGKRLKPRALDGHDGFRRYTPGGANPASKAEYAFGIVDAWPVWISARVREVRVVFAPAAHTQVAAWVASRGGALKPR